MHIDLIFAGPKQENGEVAEFHAVSIEYRILDNGPGMMAVDATPRAFAMSPYVGHCLKRGDVIGARLLIRFSPFAMRFCSRIRGLPPYGMRRRKTESECSSDGARR